MHDRGIFAQSGEAFFRDREQRVIARLLQDSNGVIATGGGAPLRAETLQAIKAKAVSVWIKAELPVLLDRVLRHDTRPLLKTGDPAQILADMLAMRRPVYAQADLALDSDDSNISVFLSAALRDIAAFLQTKARDHG